MFSKVLWSVMCTALAAVGVAGNAFGQPTYPSKPVLITVGLQAGTGSDIAVRTVAERLSAALGQQLVIENLPGAGGILAATKVARGSRDGYQLGALSNAALTIAPHLEQKSTYDPLRDIVPIAFISSFPSVLFVHPTVPAKTTQEFVSLAKRQPGKMTYASGGNGSPQHLGMEVFKSLAGINLIHIPYKGSVQATLDVVGGRVDCGFQGISTVLSFVKNGQLRAVAWTGEQRGVLYPDLPTIRESGFPDFVYEPFTSLYGPAGLPKHVIDKLNAEIRKTTAQPDLREQWARQGLEAKSLSPELLDKIIRTEHVAHAKVIKAIGIRAD